jgi:hypothetical protein
MIHNNNYLMKRIQVLAYVYGVYIYFYINPLWSSTIIIL